MLDVAEITRPPTTTPSACSTAARTCRMMENAAELGMLPVDLASGFDPSLLSHEREGVLLRALAEFPWWSRPRPSCATRTGSPATWRHDRRLQPVVRHPVPDAAQGDEPVTPVNRRAWCWSPRRAPSSPTDWFLLGVSAPRRM